MRLIRGWVMVSRTNFLRTFINTAGTKIVGFGSAAFAAAAGGGLALLVKNSLETIDAAGKMSDRLGMATESLTALQYAARQSGATNDELNNSLRLMLKYEKKADRLMNLDHLRGKSGSEITAIPGHQPQKRGHIVRQLRSGPILLIVDRGEEVFEIDTHTHRNDGS